MDEYDWNPYLPATPHPSQSLRPADDSYRDSLKHLILEQHRQRIKKEQDQLVCYVMEEHKKYIDHTFDNYKNYVKEKVMNNIKLELNKINVKEIERLANLLKRI